MNVELFFTEGCAKCTTARDGLQAIMNQVAPNGTWREVDVLKELDYAVELGVLTLPALAIDKELAFASLPTASQFERELHRRMALEANGH